MAVSGGVDSLTLARAAALALGPKASMYHAISPAVPPAATTRTRALAESFGWTLDVLDAGEFADPDYRANPVNRCYFCKFNLYSAIATRTNHQIVSGTNIDDLGEYRPGLKAAAGHNVRHPFVEAGIGKALVRHLSSALGLGNISNLPAAPCLASRIETGIVIDPGTLALIDEIEIWLRDTINPGTVRCRVRKAGLVIEVDANTLTALDANTRASLECAIASQFRGLGGCSP